MQNSLYHTRASKAIMGYRVRLCVFARQRKRLRTVAVVTIIYVVMVCLHRLKMKSDGFSGNLERYSFRNTVLESNISAFKMSQKALNATPSADRTNLIPKNLNVPVPAFDRLASDHVIKKAASIWKQLRSPSGKMLTLPRQHAGGLGSYTGVSELNKKRDSCTPELKARRLVTTFIAGRTGNRLFELATLIAAADDACYTAVHNNPDIQLISPIFGRINNLVIMDYNVSTFRGIYEDGWSVYSGPIWRTLTATTGFNWRIFGSRQSFKYFQHKKDLVRESFVFRADIQEDVKRYFKYMFLDSRTKVGIHIRRGDFITERWTKVGYFASSLDYIHKAVQYFKDRYPDTNLAFIFVSDDIKWCRETFKFANAFFSPFMDAGRDLCILTQCDHNIISTGSFGWMGAWLNETGTVIYDKSFPKPGTKLAEGYKKEDYYPGWWIGM